MATATQTVPHEANTVSPKDIPLPPDERNSTMRCPDPSVHQTKDTTLQDYASAAALYSTSPSKGVSASPREVNPLGPDGKLSAAGAATSLKHAHAHDLPSFPVVGIDTQSSAGTAATLAHANQKSPEWWTPTSSTAAGKAALLANDYKMAPLWQPEASTAGSKAALLAHRGGANVNTWAPEASSHGQSAATLAFQRQKPSAAVDYGHTADGRKRALVAATGAVSSAGRQRAQSTPVAPALYPDSENSSRNALNAATIAHRPSMRAKPAVPSDSNRMGSGAMEAARIQHSKVSRDMYTSTPPVSLEVEEKKHQDALRASAVSMAKKMYDVQERNAADKKLNRSRSAAQAGATTAQGQHGQTGEDDIKQQAMRYIGIQEAAQKLANERLAKIGFDENAAYRSYYGYEKQPARSRLSIRRGRNRAASNPETADSDDDELRSRRIRSQMSQFNKTLAEVDKKKQDEDRRYLLAAAQRKVQAQMQGLDKKIFDETGKMSPAMIEDWDAKARAKAAADSEVRMENHGKIHIGGGKYVDKADIEAVALARIQPTLDEITEKTEKKRAEEEERRLDLELKKREERQEKERLAELKAEEKRFKEEEKRAAKMRTAEEKAAAKQQKEAEKEKKAEEARLRKEEHHVQEDHKDEEHIHGAAGADPVVTSPVTERPATPGERDNDSLYRDPTPAHVAPEATALGHDKDSSSPSTSPPTSPTSPKSPRSDSKGLKSFLNKFKRRSKHSAASADVEKPGFIGGAALRQSSTHSAVPDSTNTDTAVRSTSVPTSHRREPAGISDTERRYSDVSSVSKYSDDEANSRGRPALSHVSTGVSGVSTGSSSGNYEEAKDSFNEGLAPPPTFTTLSTDAIGSARKGSPSRDSRFHEVGL